MIPPLVYFAAAYGAGLIAGLVLLVPVRAVLLLVAGAAVLAWRGGWRGTLVLAGAIGLCVGAWRADQHAGSCTARWERGDRAAWLRLEDAPDAKGRAWARLLHAPEGCGGRIRVRFSRPEGLPSGVTLIAIGTWFPPYVFRVDRARTLPRARPWKYRIRDAIAARVRTLYGPRAPLVEALVLGRRGDVDPELRGAFVDAGLAHLLAISGLHVGMLAGWMFLGCSALGARRSAWPLAAVGTWGYVALLGFPAPATRASGFITLHAVARLRARRPPGGAVLAAAALIVLAVDPDAIQSIGAWLSGAAVWGTMVAGRLAGPAARRAPWPLLVASVGAVVATSPITAWAFGSVAPSGLVTNLVAVPLAGIAVPGVFLSLLAGSLPAGGAGLTLAGIEQTAELGAALPGGHMTGNPGWRFAVPWLLVLAGLLWLLRRRPPGRLVLRRAATIGAVGAWIWVALGVARRAPADELSVHMLDVGQGDAIAIRTPRGRWILVDAGPRARGTDAGRSVVAPFLRRRGVRALDLLMVSHGDADHLGGVPSVARAVPPATVLEPGQPLGTGLYEEYLGVSEAAGADWRVGRAGDTLAIDGVTFAVLHPTSAWAEWELRPNENSLIVHLAYGAFDLLLTGDAGWPAESVLVRRVPQVEVLKVGHHGSASSTREDWLDAVRPKLAVISVGRDNRYGHPAPVVVDRLAARRIPVRRTDRDGTVTIRTDGRYFEVDSRASTRLLERIRCRIRRWLRSRASSSSRSACTPRPPGSSPTSFTTWPSPARSSPATSGGRD